MPRPYAGFPADGLRLLAELSRNNSVEWFHAHKARYLATVKTPVVELAEQVNAALAPFAEAYAARLPAAVSRPNRDTRFSKDKAPYRTDIAVVFPRNGLEKQRAAGFFFRIHPDGADVIGGVVVPGADELRTLRTWIGTHHAQLTKVLAARPLRATMGELRGDTLQRVPRPFDAGHPAGDLLRHTQLYFERTLPRAVVTSPRLLPELVKSFKVMTPFVETLDAALGNR